MLNWTFTFLIVALIAAVFGFGGIAASAVGIAKIVFIIAVVMMAISGVTHLVRGGKK